MVFIVDMFRRKPNSKTFPGLNNVVWPEHVILLYLWNLK